MFCYVAISQKVAKWSFKTTSKTTLFEDLNTFLHTLFRIEKKMKKKKEAKGKMRNYGVPPPSDRPAHYYFERAVT